MESFQRQDNPHLPVKWWLFYHARWLRRMANAELSLTAFILQITMIFYQKWVYISKEIFYDSLLKTDHKNRNYSFGGLWDYYTTHVCHESSNSTKESSYCSFLEIAKISFLLSLASALLLTCWFHCIFNPLVKNYQMFDWSGGMGSLFTACFVFFTLIFFPVHLWLQEMKMKKRLILGSSYYIGWLVFLIYIICATICFLNNRTSCRVSPQLQSQTNIF
ncbi:outer dense fiber protein 4 [Macrotis lagotis]|uniref:outer dense fiber protein 4 n=1 Tax=Macrotis lagotis TaxID=92651 RepID=UPI003D6865AB